MGLFVGVGANHSSPGIHAYDFTSLSGWGSKFSNPTPTPSMAIRTVRFSVAKDFVVCCGSLTPFLHGYAFSSSGFGTKFSNPSTLIPNGGQVLALNSAAVAVNAGTVGFGVYPVSSSGFGTKFVNPTFAASGTAVAFSPDESYIVVSATNLTPWIHAWAWSNSTGFGTKVSNPAYNPGAQATRIAFSRNGSQLAIAHPVSPYAFAWAWSGGFGARITPIGATLAGQGQDLSFGTSSLVYACSATSLGGLRGGPWSSSGFASTSILSSTTSPWPAGGGNGVEITKLPNKVFSSFQSDAKPYAMSWSETTGFSAGTSLYTAPSTLPAAVLLTISATKEDYDLLADVRSYLFTANDATLTRTVASRVIVCSVASFALTGNATGLVGNRKLAGSLGPYLVTVSATGLASNRKLVTSLGPYLVTVSATNLVANRQLSAILGPYLVTVSAFGLVANRKLAGSFGQFLLAGTATGLVYPPVVGGATLVADTASFFLVGSSTNLASNRQLLANRGPYLVTVQAAGLASNRQLPASLGPYLVTGSATGLASNRQLPANLGQLLLAGTSTGFVYAPIVVGATLVADTGSFVWLGSATNLASNRKLAGSLGQYLVAAFASGFVRGRNLPGESVSFLETGLAVGFKADRKLQLSFIAFVFAGNELAIVVSRFFVAGNGAFSFVGNNLQFQRVRRLVAGTGTFSCSMLNFELSVQRKIGLVSGSFSVAGSNLVLGRALKLVASPVSYALNGYFVRFNLSKSLAGDLWVVAAAAAWAAYSLLQKRWPSALGSTAQLAAICAGGVVVLLPFAVWEWTHGEPDLGAQALWLVVVAALVPGIGSYWIYGWTQKILGAGPVAMTMYLGPLYAAVVAWLALDEALGLHHVAGGALILAGVALVMARKKAPAGPKPGAQG